MRRGLFGGTFDPVHRAHVELAERARDAYHLDEVIFVPAWRAPHKRSEPEPVSPQHRLAMLRLAIEGRKGFSVSEIEILRKGTSYSVDTVRHFRGLYPEDELFWLMGADCYQGFSSWKDADVIRREVRLLIAGRPGSLLKEPEGVDRVEMPALKISSSEVRDHLKQGRIPGGQLQDSVMQYIRKQHLYMARDNATSSH